MPTRGERITEVVLKVLVFPCAALLFCYCIVGGFQPCGTGRMRDRHEAAIRRNWKRRQQDEPVALPPRRRALSPPPQSQRFSFRSILRSRRQKHSRLLALPVELREQILRHALGDGVLHLLQLPKRLGHLRCDLPEDGRHYDLGRECIPGYLRQSYNRRDTTATPPETSNSIAVLKTCRQLYCEGTKVLYSTNTFDINHPTSLIYLARTILPKRFESIRYLQVMWLDPAIFHDNWDIAPYPYPDDLQTWRKMWELVGDRMEALCSLKLDIQLACRYASPIMDIYPVELPLKDVLHPVRENIRDLEHFELEVMSLGGVSYEYDELEMQTRQAVCKQGKL
ncbi:hypothetical protein F5884DRAFT_778826 [Xylogone sp. PMI_703]|nr:hypothetical protein F5884DRAFT_778826 [Xylogone sp. PMI_703]